MRIGLIGCGWIAETHLANLAALGERVACVCDPDAERRAWAAGLTGGEAFADWESLLERGEPEAVLVCTPPRLHREVTEAALERGLPVYLEKPVARDLAAARAIVDAVERTGVVCAIGYQWRAIEWVPQARELFAERALGLLAVRMFGSTAGRSWFTDQAAGGGQVLERASHGIDLIQAIAGPAVRVSARGVNVPLAGADRPATSEIDDVLALTLELERGAVATVQVVWQRDDLPRTYALDVIGDGARIEGVLDPEFRARGLADGVPVDWHDAGAPSEHGMRRFLAAARAGAPDQVACTPAQATASLATALACEQALTSGGRVVVDAPA
jgi:myo-inositol 2-dehydrogenase / D-chiro-inositol 1-dehydrogenase